MMRLPWFEHRAPRSVAEAARILAGEGPQAMLLAGGTDLIPNMKLNSGKMTKACLERVLRCISLCRRRWVFAHAG